ncbi:MAG: CRISPR system precrRNA processing endoribonuclease RAMP protein Cas6, partial [Phototrophicaceae bacterium]
MTDLAAIVVELQPSEPTRLPISLGRAVHAILLRWLQAADPAASQHWHDSDGAKPYACSNLMGGRRLDSESRLIGDTPRPVWFRMSGLTPAVSEMLLNVAANPPAEIVLDQQTVAVKAIHSTPEQHRWAGSINYQALCAPYLASLIPAPRRVTLQFVSPVTFRQQGMNTPIPLPELVFGSLCDRWNTFSSVAVLPELRQYARESIAISSFRLASKSVRGKDQQQEIGGRGKVRYVHTRYDRYWASVTGFLADFAFY